MNKNENSKGSVEITERPSLVSVLYIHMCGEFGGASRSLFETINGFPKRRVIPYVITPKGSVEAFFKTRGIALLSTTGISQFDNTRYGYYRNIRWLVLLRELYYLPFTIYLLIKARYRWRSIGLIHVNELTAIVPAILAKILFKVPVIVHVRSVQEVTNTPLRVRIIRFLIKRYVDELIAIDETVRRSLSARVAAKVVHNGFLPERTFNNSSNSDKIQVENNSFVVAIVGNLIVQKGVYDFIHAAKLCAQRNPKIQFLIVGGNVRRFRGIKAFVLTKAGFYRDVQRHCEQYIRENNLQQFIRLMEFTPDISSIYNHIDLLCFPSHLNAVGRPVFEAAFFKVPSVVAIRDPLPDTLNHGVTGLSVPAHNPAALSEAILYLAERPQVVKEMGQNALNLARRNFDSKKNARKILRIYDSVLSACGS